MIEYQIDARPRHQRDESLQELHGREDEMSRPVRPRPLQSDGDPPITQPVQASLPEWWATEILAEPLEPLAVACRHVHGRMEVEAGIVAVERHVAIDPRRVGVRADPHGAPPRAPA